MHVKKLGSSVMAAMAMTAAGCSSHMYSAEARLYAEAVRDELIKAGACATADACRKNEMVLWEGGGWQIGPFKTGGVGLEVYKVADAGVADALVERCRQIHAAHPEVAVSIVIQSNAHIDNLHPGTRTIVKQADFPAVKSA
jgi:hypothetical protein